MARDTTGGGSRNKKPSIGQRRTANDIAKANARKSLTSVKGIAGLIGGAVLEGIGGPKARGAKVVTRAGRGIVRRIASEAETTGRGVQVNSRGGRVYSRATTPTRAVRKPAKTPSVATKRAEDIKKASERLSTRNKTQLSRDMTKVKINPAALGSSIKSGKPTPNRGGGLKTTTGQGKKKTSKADVFEALKGMSKAPGGSSHTTGTGAIRGTAPKPNVRITTRTSGGRGIASRAQGPAKDPTFTTKISKRSEGPSNKITEKKTVRKGSVVRDVNVTRFEKPPVVSRTVTGERMPFKSTNTEKVTVSKPIRRSTNKNGSAITVRKTTPRKAADVREEAQKARRDRLRNALTPTQNPARPKTTSAKARNGGTSQTDARREEIIDRYYRIRFGDKGGPTPRGGQAEPGSIDSRIAAGVEKANPSQRPSTSDWEANKLRTEALNPKSRVNATVKPGKRTKVAEAIKSGDRAKIIRSTKNMRKVLDEREIKEIAERARKAAEAAAKNKRGK